MKAKEYNTSKLYRTDSGLGGSFDLWYIRKEGKKLIFKIRAPYSDFDGKILKFTEDSAHKKVSGQPLYITSNKGKWVIIGPIFEKELSQQSKDGFDSYQQAVNAVKEYGYYLQD